jgi:hypothetical protein
MPDSFQMAGISMQIFTLKNNYAIEYELGSFQGAFSLRRCPGSAQNGYLSGRLGWACVDFRSYFLGA